MDCLPNCYRCGKQPCECKDSVSLYLGDCRDVLAAMEPESVDAVVSDPPYGLGFMGKDWDSPGVTGDFPMRRTIEVNTVNTGVSRQGGRQRSCVDFAKRQGRDARSFQVWCETWATEVYRVLKPGGHLLAFGGTRTYHRLTCAIEDAGFEIRDSIIWIYGSGFPKSLDVSKAIDKAAGAEREVLSENAPVKRMIPGADQNSTGSWIKDNGREFIPTETAPATDAAREWQGWGTALKPAYEPIVVARKPLNGTVAANCQKHGTGALNIDGCRIAANGETPSADRRATARKTGNSPVHHGEPAREAEAIGKIHNRDSPEVYMAKRDSETLGRWPANVIHDGSEEVVELFPQSGTDQVRIEHADGRTDESQYRIKPTPGTVKDFGDGVGSAARFFYCAKADRTERGEGNTHPTVKPLALMEYLCRLVSQPGHKGTLLDPFAGSGSTLLCASKWFERTIGIEQDEASCAIAANRLRQEVLF